MGRYRLFWSSVTLGNSKTERERERNAEGFGVASLWVTAKLGVNVYGYTVSFGVASLWVTAKLRAFQLRQARVLE